MHCNLQYGSCEYAYAKAFTDYVQCDRIPVVSSQECPEVPFNHIKKIVNH